MNVTSTQDRIVVWRFRFERVGIGLDVQHFGSVQPLNEIFTQIGSSAAYEVNLLWIQIPPTKVDILCLRVSINSHLGKIAHETH